MPNPASVYCVNSGGTILALADALGKELGLCQFGRAGTEEWTLFRAASLGESVQAVQAFKSIGRIGLSSAANDRQPPAGLPNPSAVTCIDKTRYYGSLKAVTDGSEISTCSFSDGSTIEAWTLFYGPFDPANLDLSKALGIAPW